MKKLILLLSPGCRWLRVGLAASPAEFLLPGGLPAGRAERLPFNPSFSARAALPIRPMAARPDGLLMSSFFNVEKNAAGTAVEALSPSRDLVALYSRDLDRLSIRTTFDASNATCSVLTDLDEMPRQVWPNETSRVPDGVLPFEAVVSPQGFQPARGTPGRLSLINLDDPSAGRVHRSSRAPFQAAALRAGQPGQSSRGSTTMRKIHRHGRRTA
jgi:hypothetical protein